MSSPEGRREAKESDMSAPLKIVSALALVGAVVAGVRGVRRHRATA
jgi:hypothetical protein